MGWDCFLLWCPVKHLLAFRRLPKKFKRKKLFFFPLLLLPFCGRGATGLTVGAADAVLMGGARTVGAAEAVRIGGALTAGAADAVLMGGALTAGAADAVLIGGALTAGAADAVLIGGALTAGAVDMDLAGGDLTAGAADTDLAGGARTTGTVLVVGEGGVRDVFLFGGDGIESHNSSVLQLNIGLDCLREALRFFTGASFFLLFVGIEFQISLGERGSGADSLRSL